MKKTVAAALAAAVVVGASSTTFAAANPFSDVPAGHWAYQAVTTLAEDGIVEGYGDGTYLGNRQITRYEMAQMIAKALARTDRLFDEQSRLHENATARGSKVLRRNYHAVKADLDRLAAEFRDELNELGVRVDELEKRLDRVVWNGELRYRYYNDREDRKGGGHDKSTRNSLQLRLLPTAQVNENWKIKARMTASADMKTDTSGEFKLTFAYAEGKYLDDKLTLAIGKMPFYTNVDDGMLIDDFFTGAAVTYGDKVKLSVAGGRWSGVTDDPANYVGGELSYDNDKLYVGAGYHHFRSDDFRTLPGYKNSRDANVWAVGARYNFDNGFKVGGAFAKNNKASDFEKSWYAGLGYKGADKKVAGSWGINAAYRYIGQNVSLCPTYDLYALRSNKKGVDIGVEWTPIYNTRVELGYFWGKTLDTREDDKTFFGRASWFF